MIIWETLIDFVVVILNLPCTFFSLGVCWFGESQIKMGLSGKIKSSATFLVFMVNKKQRKKKRKCLSDVNSPRTLNLRYSAKKNTVFGCIHPRFDRNDFLALKDNVKLRS